MSVTIGEQSEQLKAAAAHHLPPDVLEVFDRSIEEFLRRGSPRWCDCHGRLPGIVHSGRRQREPGHT